MKKIYILALVVALLAGFATFYFADKIDEKSNINNAPTSSVVVALIDIPANTVITEEMVALKKYTTVSVTPGTATTLEEVLGKAPKYPIVAGEQVVLSKVMTVGSSDSTGSLSFQLEEGKYAYTITVDTVTGVSVSYVQMIMLT
jgi:pilus assembly protein CpaB